MEVLAMEPCGAKEAALVDGHPATLERRPGPRGREKIRYWIGPVRVDREAWLHLTCTEGACPRRQATLHRWRERAGTPSHPGPCTIPESAAQARPSIPPWTSRRSWQLAPPWQAKPDTTRSTDRPALYHGQPVVARPARLLRALNCPQGAHEPIEVTVPGWDLFTPEGRFIATVDAAAWAPEAG